MSNEAWTAERLLLKTATILLAEERREDGDSFNLFTVLRSGSDEVNLHSRFLHALLDRRTDGRRRNLAAFLELLTREHPELGEVASLDVEGAEVHREEGNIDLLIKDSERALLIENKIYAEDQEKQLHRYYFAPELRSLRRHVIYLTLGGHEPSDQSRGEVPQTCVSCVSYLDLLPWLATCHDQAQDPALRSSIAQYRQLVRELTGGGLGAKQMDEMKTIIREAGSLTLARDLGKADDELFVDIVHDLWKRIDAAVTGEFEDEGLSQGSPSAIDCERIRQTFGLSDRRRNVIGWHGLYYPLRQQKNGHRLAPAPALGIEINGGREFFFGIRCLREDTEKLTAVKGAYGAIRNAVRGSSLAAYVRNHHPRWPCWRYVLPNAPNLKYEQVAELGDTAAQTSLAKEIAEELRKLWSTLKKHPETQQLLF